MLYELAGRFRIGRLGRNALLGSVGLGVRAIIQAIYLVLLSHWLGAQGYGIFSGWIAMVMLVAPLSGWGIGFVLSQRVAHDRSSSRRMWATALIQIAVTGVALSGVVVLMVGFMPQVHIGIVPILLLGMAELVILPVAQTATGLCFVLDAGLFAALAMCLVPVGRLLAALGFFFACNAAAPTLAIYSHFVGSIIGIIISIVLIVCIDGMPDWHERPHLRETLPNGSAYAIGGLVGSSYQEVDKALMLQLLGAAAVGPYTAAFRVISVFALPVSALISAALPRLFVTHKQSDIFATFRSFTIASTIYGIVACITAACFAPAIPYIFGKGFSEATRYLWILSIWPILFALHQSMATGLTVVNRQYARVLVEAMGLVLVVALNFLLLRLVGPLASIVALLVGEAFMAFGCWLCLHK